MIDITIKKIIIRNKKIKKITILYNKKMLN
jgi:hypothetical protein